MAKLATMDLDRFFDTADRTEKLKCGHRTRKKNMKLLEGFANDTCYDAETPGENRLCDLLQEELSDLRRPCLRTGPRGIAGRRKRSTGRAAGTKPKGRCLKWAKGRTRCLKRAPKKRTRKKR